MMFGVGLVISGLTSRLRRQGTRGAQCGRAGRPRSTRSAGELAGLADERAGGRVIAASRGRRVFGRRRATVLLRDEIGALTAGQSGEPGGCRA